MAFTQIRFDDQTPGGRELRAFLNSVQDMLTRGKKLDGSIAVGLTGDGNVATVANYDVIQQEYGCASTADALALRNEFESTYGVINTNLATFQQILNKMAIGRDSKGGTV